MKKLLLSISLSFIGLIAMECPEPVHKKQKPTQEELSVLPMEIEQNEPIILISAQGDRLRIAKSALERSPIMSVTLEFANLENNEFHELNYLSTSTLKALIPLLEQLNALLTENESAPEGHEIYIPRAYQPFVNQHLQTMCDQHLGLLYQAADFLNLPFLMNAIAAVVADQIKDRVPCLEYKNHKEQLEIISTIAASISIQVNQEYILKHILLRNSGITQEYSIADYIAQHGQPRLEEDNHIDLDTLRLTSLFGIERIQSRTQIESLSISNNFLYDISLDVQPAHNPWQAFVQLQNLSLDRNQLSKLPNGFFTGLNRLKMLNLHENRLHNLQESIFAGLVQLRLIDLSKNSLNALPAGLFAGLNRLKAIELYDNKLGTLPENIFAGLARLNDLDLNNNSLKTLPVGIFAGLAQLRSICLFDNQLKTLPENIFAGLAQLRDLSLGGNQLTSLPQNIFADLNQLLEICLRDNNLSAQEKERIQEQLPNTDVRFDD